MATMTLCNSQYALGDKHRQRCSRMDSPRVVKATVHELARIIYAIVTKSLEYMGMDRETMAEQTRQRRIKQLYTESRKFGLELAKFVDSEKTTHIQSVV